MNDTDRRELITRQSWHITNLRAELKQARQRIAELERENTQLYQQLAQNKIAPFFSTFRN